MIKSQLRLQRDTVRSSRLSYIIAVTKQVKTLFYYALYPFYSLPKSNISRSVHGVKDENYNVYI